MTTYNILARLKANIVPTLAVFIVPFGYFYGIQLRKDSDAKEIQAKWQQQSEEERTERLRKQRDALLEERQILLERQAKNKE